MTGEHRTLRLRDYFGGLTEQTFESRLGIADPPLLDYLAELLVRFVRTDALYATRDTVGRRLAEVAELMAEADARVGEAKREVHRHIGDFTLFWAGVYPEALIKLKAAGRKDQLIDYCTQGKRAYRIASTIQSDRGDYENAVLERLSHDFEMCVYGLGEIRREWEQRTGDGSVIFVV